MKLYDFGQAPNPRRVRIFLAEKGIKVPTEQVDIGALQHRNESFAALNPMQRLPTLVPPHSGFDRLHRGQSSSGRCCGSTSSSMLRAVLGCLLMNPARSSVNTIW